MVLFWYREESEAGNRAEFDSLGQILRVFESVDLIQKVITENERKIGKILIRV